MASEVEIIGRLGHACGCAWALCRCGLPWVLCAQQLPPTLAEWQAEWAREHPGEPGPAAEWKSGDERIRWVVNDNVVRIAAALVSALRHVEDESWSVVADYGSSQPSDVVELGRLMQAADGGTDG